MASIDWYQGGWWIGQVITNWAFIAAVISSTCLTYVTTLFIYNIFFHPLARFPGPLFARASRLPFLFYLNRGTLPMQVKFWHDRFGPVVRIAPDEIAFEDPAAWKDIYGHRPAGVEEFDKQNAFYRVPGVESNLTNEDRHNHGILRRQMAHGFSDRNMRAQEPLIGQYVDLLLDRLHEQCVNNDRKNSITGAVEPQSIDIMTWYNWTTFDAIGDLSMGESFGCLERGRADPWIASLLQALRFLPLLWSVKLLGLTRWLLPLALWADKGLDESYRRVEDKLRRRMELKVERPDLIEGLLRKNKEGNLTYNQTRENALLLIAAGSETTATLLAGVTYLLLKNPEALAKVVSEIRNTFQSPRDITLTSVAKLSYMLACLNEGMRIYPPVPVGLPRICPKGGAVIANQAIPEDTTVSVWHWAVYHSERLWTDPELYRPERFLNHPKYAQDRLEVLQPFSVGPRKCLGQNLAYAEMRLILARILFSFDMELVDKTTNWLDHRSYIFVWDKPALNVYLRPTA